MSTLLTVKRMRLVDVFKRGKEPVKKSALDNPALWFKFGEGSYNQKAITKNKAMELYGTHVWVHKCVNVIAQNLAKVPIKLVNKKTGNEVESHPALTVLENPNPYQNSYQFRLLSHIYSETTGECFWLSRADAKIGGRYLTIRELMLLRPDLVTVNPGTDTFIKNYEYSNGGEQATYEPDKIFHFLDPDPLNMYRGLCPLNAVSYEIYSDISANRWNKAVFDNDARADIYLVPDGDMGEEEQKRFMKQWDDSMKGVDKKGKAQLLNGIKQVIESGRTHKDVDWAAGTDIYRDKILASFGISKTIIGLSEKVNRSTSQTAIENFCQFVLEPKMTQFVAMLNQDFLAKFQGAENLAFTYDDIVPENVELELKEIDTGMKYGYMLKDEARAMRNMDGEIEGGDQPYTSTAPTPVEEKAVTKTIKAENPRDVIKKALDAKAKEYEQDISKKVIKLFKDQERDVLASTTKSIEKAVSGLNMKDAIKKFVTVFTPTFFNIYKEEGADALKDTGETFEVTEPDVKEAIKNQTVKFSTEVNETTEKQLKKTIAEGVAANETKEQMAERVKHVFKVATTARAEAIAETETTKAVNGSRQLAFKQSDVIGEKEWITLLDGKARPAHNSADGQTVSVKKNFKVDGEELEYPGDISHGASAGNTIRCRCRVVPVA